MDLWPAEIEFKLRKGLNIDVSFPVQIEPSCEGLAMELILDGNLINICARVKVKRSFFKEEIKLDDFCVL